MAGKAAVIGAALAVGVGIGIGQSLINGRPSTDVQAFQQPAQVAAAPIQRGAEEQNVISVARQASPTVVGVSTREGSGSGVMCRRDGVILTNAHVVGRSGVVEVSLADGRQLRGEVIGGDARVDLAVIRVNATDLPVARLGDSDRLERFVLEARAASALNHPHLIAIYDIGESSPKRAGTPVGPPVLYIAMELVSGQTLRAALEEKRLNLERTLEFLAQVADALDAAHSAGVTHRDLKPENLMIAEGGYAKVLDFGIAKLRADLMHGPAKTEHADPGQGSHEPTATDLALMSLEAANNVNEGITAAHRAGMPAQNILLADDTGAIAWTIAGRVPKRVGYDGRLPVTFTYGDRKWDGYLPLIPPSYNAGENAVTRWLEARGEQAADEWIESIVDDQPRGYSKRVIASFFTYTYLYTGEIPRLGNTIPRRLLP
jgi:hypothetical protein